MNSLAELLGGIVFVICCICLAIGVISLPFAFIGFILLAAANVFSAGVTITYITSAVVGLAAIVLVGIFSS